MPSSIAESEVDERRPGRVLRLGVNGLFLVPGRNGGTETYVASLLPPLLELAAKAGHQVICFSNRDGAPWWRSIVGNLASVCVAPVSGRNRVARVLVEQSWLIWAARAHQLSVLWSPGFVSPVLSSVPKVVTVHDAQVWDMPGLGEGLRERLWKVMVPASIRTARVVLTDSTAAAARLTYHFSPPNGRLRVVHLAGRFSGTEIGASSPTACLGEPYYLAVATMLPHKNLDRVVAAFARLAPHVPERLVVVGNVEIAHRLLDAAIRSSGVDPARVSLLGYVSDPELVTLYRGATALVFPSLYEGFGLPILEAMAFGCPVIASDIPVLHEVAGDAAVFVAPERIDSIQQAMLDVRNPLLRSRLAEAGRQRLAAFSWARAAAETLDALECSA